MKIAVDAMGGDHAPREIVKGAVEAIDSIRGLEKLFLVGDEQAVQAELDRCNCSHPGIEVRHASEVIEMGEHPAQGVRRKKDSSIGRAVDLVKSGEADAIISAGSTGAAVVAATLKLRALEGVTRPGIAAVMPTRTKPIVLLDAGANTDCPAGMLLDFAVMGNLYSRFILGQENPVVGLLSIGSEDIKGNDATREAFKMIEESGLNFRGNVEGHDLFEGEVDVVVCDGFVGNVVLKTTESAATAIGHWIKQEFKKGPIRLLGCMLLSGGLKAVKSKLDPESYGGAPLLGVNGICIITHGGSSSRAIYNAIRVGAESIESRLNEKITTELKAVHSDS
jgi:glycerol-3-phosphate acyltransferase PlsX